MAVSSKKVKRQLSVAARTNSNRVHITPRSNGWAVRKEGNLQASRIVSTQKEAIKLGKKWVAEGKSSLVIVHNKKGQFRKG